MNGESAVLAIRLPQDLEKRLEELAKRTGRTKTYYVREAIVEHLDDLEDLYLAEARLQALRSGEDRVADAPAPYLRVGDCTVTCRREGDSVHVVVSPSRRRTIAS
jgi:RHH-type rel operon transcriptional repressor/antitoxin RelB